MVLCQQFWNTEDNRKLIVDIYTKVCKIQAEGGMPNEQIGGFKTSGGIFITLMKQERPEIKTVVRQEKNQTRKANEITQLMLSQTLE